MLSLGYVPISSSHWMPLCLFESIHAHGRCKEISFCVPASEIYVVHLIQKETGLLRDEGFQKDSKRIEKPSVRESCSKQGSQIQFRRGTAPFGQPLVQNRTKDRSVAHWHITDSTTHVSNLLKETRCSPETVHKPCTKGTRCVNQLVILAQDCGYLGRLAV